MVSGRFGVSRGLWVGLTVVAATAAVTTGPAGPAWAATRGVAKVSGTAKVEYRAGSGKANKVTVTRSGRVVTIDDTVTVRPGKGCRAVKGDVTRVRCTTARTPTRVAVYTGDRNDSVVNRSDLAILVRAGSGNNRIVGGPRRDHLYADDGRDRIYGNGGNDYVYAAGGADVVDGGAGKDTLLGGDGPDRLFGGPDFDRLDGGAGNDVTRGGAGGDSFDETPGRDVLFGDGGDDVFFQNLFAYDGVVSPQDIRGGAGVDRVNYASRTRGIVADLDGRRGDDGQRGEGDTIGADVESIEGGAGADVLTGGPGPNQLSGGAGNDRLTGHGGDDGLTGEAGNDRLDAGAGTDALDGGPGSDVMLGGSGVDSVYYGDRRLPVVADLDGSAADDGVRGERDTIGADVEQIQGGDGDDVLTGNAAVNFIYGGPGADTIRGGAGDDDLWAADGAAGRVDRVYGGAGDDVLTGNGYGGEHRYLLDGGPQDTVVGDSCVISPPGTGELVDCERTDG